MLELVGFWLGVYIDKGTGGAISQAKRKACRLQVKTPTDFNIVF
jgi:hypothetical protein